MRQPVTIDTLKSDAQALYPQLMEWRRDFHRHPELGFSEVRTADIVARRLNELGLEVATGIGKTGVVGLVEGDALPTDAPTVMLRFDMDALPLLEESEAPYASLMPGVMHACGHDGHTAIGMGVATLLSRHRNELPGRVKLVFQPAEEGAVGARAMIADGVLESPLPGATFGVHLWSRLPLNEIVVQAGPLFAAADIVTITVRGKGGHGAMPHETIDATVVASHIVVALQTVVSRSLSPTDAGVVSVGSFHSGTASNIISERAELACTIRSTEKTVRATIVRRMEEICLGISSAFGATVEVELRPGTPATRNAVAETALMREVAAAVVGSQKVTQITPMMVGEDMAEFLNRVPGCFVLIGASDPQGPLHAPHHNVRFDFDERMLPTGVALLAGAAFAWLESQP